MKCEREFSRISSLKNHLSFFHPDTNENSDNSEEFSDNSEEDSNRSEEDSDRSKEDSDNSGKLSDKSGKESAKLTENSDKINHPFQCKICLKIMKNKYILKTHMSLHEGKKFKCNICGWATRHRVSLKNHHLRHLRKQMPTCQICICSFKNISGFKVRYFKT